MTILHENKPYNFQIYNDGKGKLLAQCKEIDGLATTGKTTKEIEIKAVEAIKIYRLFEDITKGIW